MKHAIVFIVLALFLAACAAPSTPAPSPTSPPKTPSATPEATLAVTTTLIPLNTMEPEASATPTATFVFALPSLTPTAQGTPVPELDCQLLSQSVPNGTHFKPKERFDVGWKVTNSGLAGWDPSNVVFAFFGGAKMYSTSSVRLETGVAAGDTTALVADMVAPKNPNKYTTFWGLRRGNQFFCRVSLMIYVP